ncbi:hypothetical protein IFM89_006028 [Coptis chinensis]|uniref:Uncharacterized protein n=1 Tax=Coptis chinensis TaxID=261450 RepID=A0A835HYM1_9MAGN|nr:hypothetical protein IFM89_006028 [Coptis chinensis]
MSSNYELFKKCLEKARESEEMRLSSSRDRLPLIEVMRHNETEEFIENKVNIPRLVYVSREKRSTHHHNFKAGAINVLLRVSGLISNAPYLLVLDCDMNCNDPMSARQAMCFILDPMISKELAFVQFPQYFHNISENDIYNSQMRTFFKIGFRYHSLVEDVLTGMLLHTKGWTSVYYDPPQPAFLGTGTTNLNDTLVQNTRWNSGLLQVSVSKFCPLTYQPSKMSILQTLAYSCLAFQALTSFSVLCLSIVPQLCLLKGITLYPKVSDPWFAIFAIVYMSYTIQHFVEVLCTGGSFKLFWNGQRTSFTVSAIPYLFACVDFFLKCIGMKDIDFRPTNKSSMEDEIKKYHNGIFDFETDIKFVLIFTTIATLNVASFLVGLKRAITETSYNKLFGQISLSFAIVAVYYPVLEAMALRKDKGSISTHVTVLTMGFLMVLYHMFNLLL